MNAIRKVRNLVIISNWYIHQGRKVASQRTTTVPGGVADGQIDDYSFIRRVVANATGGCQITSKDNITGYDGILVALIFYYSGVLQLQRTR
jgi:hypothetical protein